MDAFAPGDRSACFLLGTKHEDPEQEHDDADEKPADDHQDPVEDGYVDSPAEPEHTSGREADTEDLQVVEQRRTRDRPGFDGIVRKGYVRSLWIVQDQPVLACELDDLASITALLAPQRILRSRRRSVCSGV